MKHAIILKYQKYRERKSIEQKSKPRKFTASSKKNKNYLKKSNAMRHELCSNTDINYCKNSLLALSVFLLRQTISLQIFQRLSSTNFTLSILEYFVSFQSVHYVSGTMVLR